MENKKISEITPYGKNAKKHPQEQIEKIAASIKEFGFAQPVVIDEKGVVIVGHGRLEAAKLLGMTEVPTLTLKLNEEQARAYRLADNKLNESEWDMDLVIDELKTLSEQMLDLTGFDRDLLLENDEKDDDAPELPAEARSVLGDVYQLGNHRIICGDATNPDDLAKLMGGAKADMVFTDPPYNVDYKGKGTNTSQGIANDNMSNAAFDQFLVDSFENMKSAVKSSAGIYVFHSHKTAGQFENALKKTGYTIDTQLIWNKPSAGMGANDYRTKHEPFFYVYRGEKLFYGDRTGTTVWKVPESEADRMKWWLKFTQKQEEGSTTVWSMRRENVRDYVHPTQKPVELIVRAIHNSSKEEDIVLDPFLGSGSTLIAAEKAHRNCYGMELDPRYVDVIVQRYCDYLGTNTIVKNGVEMQWR